jgi:hypothetical protein
VEVLARLQPGDRGFVAWTTAKREFVEDVQKLVRNGIGPHLEAGDVVDDTVVEQYLRGVCPGLLVVSTGTFF